MAEQANAGGEGQISSTLDGAPVARAELAAAVAGDYSGATANNFTVEIQTRDGTFFATPNLKLSAKTYSGNVLGGGLLAEITVTGTLPGLWFTLDWLNFRITIRNGYGHRVWVGNVENVVVGWGKTQIGLSLRDMYNKITAQYTRSNADNDATSVETDWVTDAVSIAAFGTKELRLALNESTKEQAESQRDTAMAIVKMPAPMITIGETEAVATLSCVGVWYLLDWVYYKNDTGYIVHESDTVIDQPIGFSVTKNDIGFYSTSLHQLTAELTMLYPGQWFIVSGASTSNGTYQVAREINTTERVIYGNVNITFEATDDVYDYLNGFGRFTAGEMIYIGGSAHNTGYYRIKTIDQAGHSMIVTPKTLASEAPGPAITFTQGGHVVVENWEDGGWAWEGAGAWITLKSYEKIAQSLYLGTIGSWDAQEILLQVRTEGTCADNLRVSIYTNTTNDQYGVPGTRLAYKEVTPAEVGPSLDWFSFMMDVPVTITHGTFYFIVVERTGLASDVNYWSVAMGPSDVERAWGWNGSAWVEHAGQACLIHQVWATVDTATAAANMLATSEFISSVNIQDLTGVRTRLYRDGSKRVREELEALAFSGTDTDKRLRIYITSDRVGVVGIETDQDYKWRLDSNGDLRSIPNNHLLANGLLPLTYWVSLPDLPPLSYMPNAVYIEAAEFSVENNEMTLTPRGYKSDWE